ncbi:bifunctional metallophosphatase/5'-nucleotidase [Periweissella cryptocerci]|uniref:Bifunctional metallophosphatase/5'-nucleotidase n=1 Tax=Periweissella cryptocerci TaxID=2506420 RepID=A0A4P6YTY5_9LACO|nr:5'-nucleotidase C-terminal domain-containing protein [Periweissella cryptocerci]QBO36127.1 bifunctional metallophosphatase/5'-nucleotidase [Periweissella cryptocerci]
MRLFSNILRSVAVASLLLSATPIASFADSSSTGSDLAPAADKLVPTSDAKVQTAGPQYAPLDPAKYSDDIPVQILGFNDFHGALNVSGNSATIPNAADILAGNAGTKYSNTGTAPRLAAYLDKASSGFAAAHPNAATTNSIRVEAGDLVGASPASSAFLQDEPSVNIANAMGIQIATLGNHEFDEGLGEFNRIATAGNPASATQNNDLIADYNQTGLGADVVIANVTNKEASAEFGAKDAIPFGWKPYTIKEVKNADGTTAKVGFIGILTTDMPNLTLVANYGSFNYLDPADTIAKYSAELQAQGVKAIVVMGHTALGMTKDASGKFVPQEDTVDIMNKLNKQDPDNSVDLYVAGHSHEYANGIIKSANGNETHVVQALNQSKAFDDFVGYIDPKTQDFDNNATANVYPVLNATDDPSLTAADGSYLSASANKVKGIVTDAESRVANTVNRQLVHVADGQTISKAQNSLGESVVGDIVADGQLAQSNKVLAAQGSAKKVDFAMTNIGGVRLDLQTNAAGYITYGAVAAVQPFGNIVDVVEMTGAQIRQVLNQNFKAENRNLQFAGLKYTVDTAEFAKSVVAGGLDTNGKQVTAVKDIYTNAGQKLDENKTYNVAINDFLWGGGDGYSGFKGTQLVESVGVDTDFFSTYFSDMATSGKDFTAPTAGRILDANGAAALSLQIASLQADLDAAKQANADAQSKLAAATVAADKAAKDAQAKLDAAAAVLAATKKADAATLAKVQAQLATANAAVKKANTATKKVTKKAVVLKAVKASHKTTKVTGTATKKATIKLYDAKTGKKLGSAKASKTNGKFTIKLHKKLKKGTKIKLVASNSTAKKTLVKKVA